MFNTRFWVLTAMIAAAVASRLLPHPPNFAPIAAMALMGGAHFSDKRLAFLVPLTAMLMSDLFIGMHSLMPLVYGSFIAIVAIGFLLKGRVNTLNVTVAALAGSVLFFLVTNFGVWAMDGGYPNTLAGLMACYTAAIPFFQNTVMGNLFYSGVLFGGYALLERRFPVLQPSPE